MDIEQDAQRRHMAALLPDLRGFARFLTRDRSAADDLVQESLVRALAALPQFQPGTSMKAWMFTILRNVFYEQRRRGLREAAALLAGFEPDPPEASAQDRSSDIADLQRHIWSLPPLLREALILVGAQELSHEDAARVCNVPVGTMKARLSRARTALATAMRASEAG